jgi:putative ABC transport system permease protein
MVPLAERLPPSLRGLLRHKRFAAMAIASLAIAIALNTTMYSVTDALLFPRIEMRDPGDLYRMPFFGDYKGRLTPDVKLEAIRGFSFFEDIALAMPNFTQSNQIEYGTTLEAVQVLNVSANYFTLLGVTPKMGRLLGEGDVQSPANPVVISERLWKKVRPNGEPFDTVTVMLSGSPRTVVGVLAHESDFPGGRTDMWQLPTDNASQWQQRAFVFNVVRLKKGMTPASAYQEMQLAAARLSNLAGDGPNNARFELRKKVSGPMEIGGLRLGVIYAVLMVLFVACFNLANLQLARGLSRQRELATRAAVGATRRDLVRLLVGESAWLAGAGLIFGIILTFWGIHLVRTSIPEGLGEFVFRPQVSWRLFVFAGVTGSLALAIVGLIPAIKVSRVDVNELLKAGAGTGSLRKTRWQAGALVVCQVGLALILIVGATFLIRTAANLHMLEINPLLERIVHGWVRITPNGELDHRTMRDVSNQMVARAQAIDGVQYAATSRSELPTHRVISLAQDGALPREVATGTFGYSVVSPDFLRVYGTKIAQGRDFLPGETDRSVIMDFRTARYLWPGENPIGKQLKFGSDARRDAGWLTVVGISEYVNLWGSFRTDRAQEERTAASLGAIWVLNSIDTARVYRGMTALGSSRGERTVKTSSLDVYVRSGTRIARLPVDLQRSIADASAGFSVGFSSPLESALQLDATRKTQDFMAALFTSFALIALAMSSLGVYAVVSHTVGQRTREIGVRVALGATERDIRQSVLFHGNVMALSGIAVGLAIKAYAEGALDLRGWTGNKWDFVLFAVACVVMFAATLLAAYVPARRAMRINPVEALRAD